MQRQKNKRGKREGEGKYLKIQRMKTNLSKLSKLTAKSRCFAFQLKSKRKSREIKWIFFV